MPKVMRKLLKIIFLIFLVIFLAIAAIVTFINPNDYKKEISNLASNATGSEVEILGSVQWSLVPSLALYVEGVSISNQHLGNKVSIKEAHIRVEPWGLIKGNLDVQGLELNGADLVINLKNQKSSKQQGAIMLAAKKHKNLSIRDLVVKNFNVDVTSEKGDKVLIKGLNVNTQNFRLNPVGNSSPIKFHFDLIIPKVDLSPVTVDSTLSLDIGQDSATFSNNKILWKEATFVGDLQVRNMSTKSKNAAIAVQLDSSPNYWLSKVLSNKLDSANLKKLPKHFHVRSKLNINEQSCNIDNMLVKMDKSTIKLNGMISNKKNILSIYSENLDANLASSLTEAWKQFSNNEASTKDTSIALDGKNILWKDEIINFEQARLHVTPKSMSLNFPSINALGGKHKFNISHNDYKWKFNLDISKIDMERIAKSLELQRISEGQCSCKMQATARGSTSKTILNTAKGAGGISITNARFKGIDASKVISGIHSSANKLIRNSDKKDFNMLLFTKNNLDVWSKDDTNHQSTHVENIDVNFNIDKGNIKFESIKASNSDIVLSGNGAYNFIKDYLNCSLRANTKADRFKDDAGKIMAEIPVYIIITGPKDNLNYKVDSKHLSKTLIKLFQKQIFNDLVKNIVKPGDLFG